jgi:hypothetical protein
MEEEGVISEDINQIAANSLAGRAASILGDIARKQQGGLVGTAASRLATRLFRYAEANSPQTVDINANLSSNERALYAETAKKLYKLGIPMPVVQEDPNLINYNALGEYKRRPNRMSTRGDTIFLAPERFDKKGGYITSMANVFSKEDSLRTFAHEIAHLYQERLPDLDNKSLSGIYGPSMAGDKIGSGQEFDADIASYALLNLMTGDRGYPFDNFDVRYGSLYKNKNTGKTSGYGEKEKIRTLVNNAIDRLKNF